MKREREFSGMYLIGAPALWHHLLIRIETTKKNSNPLINVG